MPAADEARKRVGQRILLAKSEAPPAKNNAASARELLDTVIEGLKIEVRRIRQANASLIPPVEVARAARRSPILVIQLKPSESLQLLSGFRLNVVVEVIDVDAQAIIVQIAAATSDVPIDEIPAVEVFKGPYSSAAISDRIEAALFLCLDQVQRGVEGSLNLDGLGGT
jgi:hypothetical protein